MKRLNILFAFVLTLLASCVNDEADGVGNTGQSVNKGIHIIGAVEDFDMKFVGARAEDGDTPADSYISEMTMFVFDKNGNLVQGYTNRTVNSKDAEGNPTSVTFLETDKCSSAINIQKANPTFVIDTKGGLLASLDEASPRMIYYDNLTDNNLSACTIYIVANAWHKLEGVLNNITTLTQLEAVTLDIDATLAMPKKDDGSYRGFPMIGTHAGQTFDLTKSGNNAGAVAKIPLKKLYSKINFTMQVNANEVVTGQVPKFKIAKVEVFNVPKKARLGRTITNGKPDYSVADDYIVEMVGGATYTPTDYYHFTEEPFVITDFSRTEIQHTTSKEPSSDYIINFGFYMPEHKVTPNYTKDTYPYPTGMDEDFHQYYKPELIGAVRNDDGTTTNAKYATFVRIHGTYTDHNAQIKTVRYDIYLGQDNSYDFTIKRNQLLKNKLIITGLTNYHDAYEDVEGNISIDYRVDVDYMGFNLSMERTAILDAHFEVRPLDIELSPGSTMTITIPEAYRGWVAMENDATAKGGSSDVYINTTTPRKGVRKYFTTNLVSELTTANNGTLTIAHSGQEAKTEIHRLWFYIDENPNVYDKTGATTPNDDTYTVSSETYRNCPVSFKYYGTDNDNTGGAATVTRTVTVNFQQWNLWRVWSADGKRYYDIEHEEEYLNNYASDQQYGGTQDGMAWGLEGLQISDTDNAFYIQSKINSNYITQIFSGNKANAYKYDFYVSEEESQVIDYSDLDGDGDTEEKIYHPYSGRAFTEKIVNKGIAVNNPATNLPYIKEKRTLVEDPESAVEYCYNKNKRDSEGAVEAVRWYLPAIDEIEDITSGAYNEFDKVFQDKFYWSSQPAYTVKKWHGTFNIIFMTLSYEGTLYVDNVNFARSTSVKFNGTDYPPQPSGMYNPNVTVELGGMLSDATPTESINNSITPTYDSGYDKRDEKNRIRAVYRSGITE